MHARAVPAPTALPRQQRHRICNYSQPFHSYIPFTERIIVSLSFNGHCRQRILENKAKKPILTLFSTQSLYHCFSALQAQVSLGPFCLVSSHTTMPDIAALDSTNLATPRSPASISTESSRCGSFKPTRLSARDSEQCLVGSPPGRLTRKRAAILDTERSTLSQGVGDLVIHGASTIVPPPPDPTRDQVCLCQPDPKIPRPRNGIQYALLVL
jgi:hypothetical protein